MTELHFLNFIDEIMCIPSVREMFSSHVKIRIIVVQRSEEEKYLFRLTTLTVTFTLYI